MKVIASALLIASGPLGWWVAWPQVSPEYGGWEPAGIEGLVWLGVGVLLALVASRFPRLIGWLLIGLSPFLLAFHWFVAAFSEWSERAQEGAAWGDWLFLAATAGLPFVAGVLFAIEGSLASRRRQRSLWEANRS